MDIAKEIKDSFKEGSGLTRLIYVNVFGYVAANLFVIVFFFFNQKALAVKLLAEWVMVSSDFQVLLTRPWTIFSYMFLHTGFFHFLFNILWLYWFGRVFLHHFTQRHMVGLYLLGGVGGALFYLLAFNFLPVFADQVGMPMLGASAAIWAIVMAITAYRPDIEFHLLLIGRIRIIYITLVFLGADILTLAETQNPGGHLAHIGGALVGYLFVLQYRRGKDMTKGINLMIDALVTFFKPRPKIKVTYKSAMPKEDGDYNIQKKTEQEQIDQILDKIARSGYESLSVSEKEFLFKAGKR